MKYKISFITEEDINFEKLKEDSVGGVIFSPKSLSLENLIKAKQNKLKRFIHIGELTKSPCNYITDCGVKQGKIGFVSVSAAERMIKDLGEFIELIDGVVIPAPCISGLFWSDLFPLEYEKFCGKNLYDELPLLFDGDTIYADVRIWYYKRAAEKIFSEYVLPVCKYIKSCRKTACTNLGNMERGDFLIRKLLIPSLFDKAKIPTIREENGDSYFISPMHNKNSKTLFVTAIKDIMGLYAWDFPYSKIESDFSTSIWEEKYYRESLKKCGIEAYVIDEFALSKMRLKTLKKFDDILLQRENIMERKEKLKNMGVRINSSELLKRLDMAN